MVVPFLTIYLTRQHHYSIAQAGIVMGFFGAGAIAGGFIGGRLTDKYGFYPINLLLSVVEDCFSFCWDR